LEIEENTNHAGSDKERTDYLREKNRIWNVSGERRVHNQTSVQNLHLK